MANRETITKPQKFLFTQNDFTDNGLPAAPVFSEDQLGAARKEAFEQGRRAGLAEAQQQREKHVADLLGAIKQNFTALFAAEDRRAGQYEAESLSLCRAIFGRLFPGLNERHGLDEVMRAIVTVLEGQRMRPEIIVEVHPDYAEDVRAHIGEAVKSLHEGTCTIAGNADLGPGDCRLRWNDGGAERSATKLCAQVGRIFEQTLADKPALRDNEPITESGHE